MTVASPPSGPDGVTVDVGVVTIVAVELAEVVTVVESRKAVLRVALPPPGVTVGVGIVKIVTVALAEVVAVTEIAIGIGRDGSTFLYSILMSLLFNKFVATYGNVSA